MGKVQNTYFINLYMIFLAITPQIRNEKKVYKIKVLTREKANELKTFLSW